MVDSIPHYGHITLYAFRCGTLRRLSVPMPAAGRHCQRVTKVAGKTCAAILADMGRHANWYARSFLHNWVTVPVRTTPLSLSRQSSKGGPTSVPVPPAFVLPATMTPTRPITPKKKQSEQSMSAQEQQKRQEQFGKESQELLLSLENRMTSDSNFSECDLARMTALHDSTAKNRRIIMIRNFAMANAPPPNQLQSVPLRCQLSHNRNPQLH